MLPVIALIGRPNVGKSTLFNWLTKSRDALVADTPGVTRDRLYGRGMIGERPYFVVDTGGIEQDDSEMSDMMKLQVKLAIEEADKIFFLVDAVAGLTPGDEAIAKQLRPYADKVTVLVNKTDHRAPELVSADFFSLGLRTPVAVSARRGQGVKQLMAEVLADFPEREAEQADDQQGIKIAIVGRPNVGKSTLTNRLLGEERVVVFDEPGTTRDSIFIPYERRGQKYVLIDTAGMRRRAKVYDALEKLSLIKTLQAMEKAQVVILVVNAQEGILEQDLRLLGMIVNLGKGVVLAFNKWDGMEEDAKAHLKSEIDRRMQFVNFARRYFISAKHGSGVGKLYHAVDETFESAAKKLSTAELTRALEQAITDHQPPLVKGRRVKPRFAHLGGHHPMVILIHGKQMDKLPLSYKRYLMNYFRKHFNLIGIPLIIHFKCDDNPYADKQKKH